MKKNKKPLMILVITLGVIFYLGSAQAEYIAPSSDELESTVEITNDATQTIEEVITTSDEVTNESGTTENVAATNEDETSNLIVYEKTHYSGGETLNLEGHFLNDVIVAGNNITIDGVVEGDVLATGANITINADVKGNIRTAGANIIINSTVDKNVTVAGGQINISSNSYVKKDLTVYAGTVIVDGKIDGELMTGAGQVTINNEIGGNADLSESGQIILGEDALIKGDLTYIVPENQKVNYNFENQVSGKVKETKAEKTAKVEKENNGFAKYNKASFWIWSIIKLLALLIVSLVIVNIFRTTTEKAITNITCCPGKSLLWGALFLFFAPVVCILCMITIIGFPLGILGMVGYGVLLYIGAIFAGVTIGDKIMPGASLTSKALIGVLILFAVKLLPFVGGFLFAVSIMWGIGALIRKKCTCTIKPIAEEKTVVVAKKTTTKKRTTKKKTTTKKS